MFQSKQTREFAAWLAKLRDRSSRRRILERLARVEQGNFGDSKSVGGGVSELRVDTGPGYRIYYSRRGETLLILLIGGDKDSQDRDIKRAREILAKVGDGDD